MRSQISGRKSVFLFFFGLERTESQATTGSQRNGPRSKRNFLFYFIFFFLCSEGSTYLGSGPCENEVVKGTPTAPPAPFNDSPLIIIWGHKRFRAQTTDLELSRQYNSTCFLLGFILFLIITLYRNPWTFVSTHTTTSLPRRGHKLLLEFRE